MALTKCKECGKEVSESAGKCPHCGAKVKKPVGPVGVIVAALVLAFVATSMINSNKAKKDREEQTPEQRAAKQADEQRFMMATVAAKKIKAALRDPDSVVWEDIYSNEGSTTICLAYRAKNGFGGMNRERIAYVKGVPSASAEIWNTNCTGTGFFDLKHVRHAL